MRKCPSSPSLTKCGALPALPVQVAPFPTSSSSSSLMDGVEFYSSAHTTVLNALTCERPPEIAVEADDVVGACLATPVEEAQLSCPDIPASRWTTWTRRIRKRRMFAAMLLMPSLAAMAAVAMTISFRDGGKPPPEKK